MTTLLSPLGCSRQLGILVDQDDLWIKIDTYNIGHLSHDIASGIEITPCNKIDKPLVVYRFLGNVMTSITMLRT